MKTLPSRNLSLNDIHQILGFQRQYNQAFTNLLSLEALTEFEQQELAQIRTDFDDYLIEGGVSEGQVKLLALAPLLRLAGFYRHPLKIILEEGIAEIIIEDDDTKITGRIDILAINRTRRAIDNTAFWVLVIESKNSEVAPGAGLPQLLSYAFKSLEHQEFVWGLTTNGNLYQFVYIQSGNSPVYQLMPFLNLMESASAIQILQVFKAIRQV